MTVTYNQAAPAVQYQEPNTQYSGLQAGFGAYVVEMEATATGTYTDITQYVLHAQYGRGRDYPSQLVGRSIAGSIELELDNRDGRWNSFATAGPYYGNLLPGRKVRIRTVAPVAATCQVGWLDQIVPKPSHGGLPTARLSALGPLSRFSERQAKVAPASGLRTSSAVHNLLDDAGIASTTDERQISSGQTTMVLWHTEQPTLAALRELENTESGFLWETAGGAIAFADRQFRLRSPYTVSQATWRDADTASLQYQDIGQRDPRQNIYNLLEAQVQPYASGALATLWNAPAGQIELNYGQTLDIWANYPNPDSSRDAAAVDSWTTPASNTDYVVNSASGGGGTSMTSAVSVTVTKFANSMQMRFSATASGFGAVAAKGYFTTLQARGIPLSRGDPITITAEDTATSQVRYDKRRYPNPGPFIPTAAEAVDWAGWNLSQYKDPNPILTIDVLGNTDNTHLTQILQREINDRITLVATATGLGPGTMLGINEDFFIEAISGDIDRRGVHRVSYDLSRAAISGGGFWVLGSAALGTDTRLAY